MQTIEGIQFENGLRPLTILSPKNNKINTLIEPLQTEKALEQITTDTQNQRAKRLETQEAEKQQQTQIEEERAAEAIVSQQPTAVTSAFFIAPTAIQMQQAEQLKMTRTQNTEQLLQQMGWEDAEQKALDTKFELEPPEIKKAQAIADLQQAMAQVKNNTNLNIVNQLIQAGLSLQQLDLNIIAKAMQQARLIQERVQQQKPVTMPLETETQKAPDLDFIKAENEVRQKQESTEKQRRYEAIAKRTEKNTVLPKENNKPMAPETVPQREKQQNIALVLETAVQQPPRQTALADVEAQQPQTIINKDVTQHLNMMEGKASAQVIDLMSTLYEKMAQMTPVPSSVYRDIYHKTVDFNIHSNVTASTQARLRQGYETAATQPDPKYGDSYRQVQPQIQQRILEMGLPNTKENQQAYEILSKNQMEPTMENMNQIQSIQRKVQQVVEQIQPDIVAKMLDEGINPLEMHLDQVLDYMKPMQEPRQNRKKDAQEARLLKLDKMKVSEQQKNAIMAVYRALNQITRNNSVALGVAMKNGINTTLGNLLEAAKYFEETRGRSNKIDVEVDTSFGFRDAKETQTGSIRTVLEKEVQTQRNKQDEAKQNQIKTEQLARKINPENYERFTEDQQEEKNIQAVNETARVHTEDRMAVQEKATEGIQYANAAIQNNPHLLVWLQASGLPVTVKNVHIAQAVVENKMDVASAIANVKGVDNHYENWS